MSRELFAFVKPCGALLIDTDMQDVAHANFIGLELGDPDAVRKGRTGWGAIKVTVVEDGEVEESPAMVFSVHQLKAMLAYAEKNQTDMVTVGELPEDEAGPGGDYVWGPEGVDAELLPWAEEVEETEQDAAE